MQAVEAPRATQRYLPIVRDDEKPLTQRIIELASMYGWYGYRMIHGFLGRGLVGEPQAGGTDLASGRSESAEETAQTRTSVA